MNRSLRIYRSIVLLLAGLAAIFLNKIMTGFPMLFAVALVISAGLTVIFIFLQFDKPFSGKPLMELIADGFSGLTLLTYPVVDERFFIIVFGFWIAWMGILWLASGLTNPDKKDFMWFYTLSGIVFIVLGFVIINYSPEMMESVNYVIGFALTFYGILCLYLQLLKKRNLY